MREVRRGGAIALTSHGNGANASIQGYKSVNTLATMGLLAVFDGWRSNEPHSV